MQTPRTHRRRGISAFAGLALVLFVGQLSCLTTMGAIPKRPEKLKFPPLVYEPPTPADYRVALESGPVAYVVPDRELPLVNVVIYVRTGEYLEPVGKQGLASLAGYLLTRGGTRSRSAEDLEERLAFLAARLDSGVGETQGSISLNLLSKDLDEGLTILREVLTAPGFQEDKLVLRKQQMLQEMKQRNDESREIQDREEGFLALGTNFWANRYPTAASVESLQRRDLESFHHKWFYPSNFVLAVSGDFARDQMVAKLEHLFANWPFQGEKPSAIPTNTVFATPGAYIVDKDVDQGRVVMMLPGIMRDSPDFFPIMVMNDILGGGGFTSRIMNRVRSDEGLAYDAHTSFPGGVYWPLTFSTVFQSKSSKVPYAISIALEELRRMRSEPVTTDEMNTSKRGFIDQFPRKFATKAQVANTFAQDEFTGRYSKDPEYWKQFRAHIEAVGPAQVLQVAQRYLTPEKLVLLIVGQRQQILAGDAAHPVKLSELVGGRVTEVPLRDPLTMQPMPAGNPAKK